MQKSLILAVVLLGTASAYAQNKFGNVTIMSPQSSSVDGAVSGPVTCDSITACNLPDPMMPTENQPAISFDVTTDALIHIEASLYDGLDCATFIQTVAGDLTLPAGHDIVYLNFQPPLPAGTQLSLIWSQVGACTSKTCSNYTIGSDPPVCM